MSWLLSLSAILEAWDMYCKFTLLLHSVRRNWKQIPLNTLVTIKTVVGTYIFFICDSCDTNVILFMEKLNLPRKSFMCITDFHIILVCDYVNYFKNISDNWITDQNRELLFTEDGNIDGVSLKYFTKTVVKTASISANWPT